MPIGRTQCRRAKGHQLVLIGADYQSKRLLVIVDDESVLLTSIKICTRRKLAGGEGVVGISQLRRVRVSREGGR